ncbi:MAG: hypothetical protein HY910_09150 [Desulfarculus sp.]|nr:hypothetical protein [Desulfarculus sp.]
MPTVPPPEQPRPALQRLAGLLAGLCLGLLAGCLLALLAGRWVWLGMRVNTGLLVPLGALLGGLAGLKKPLGAARPWLLAAQAALVAAAAWLLGFDRQALLVVPACLFREGCHLPGLSLTTTNALLASWLLAGNALWLVLGRRLDQPHGLLRNIP